MTERDTSRRGVLAGAVGLGLTAGIRATVAKGLPSQDSKEIPMTTKKPAIVFAHGLWADGSCFNKLVPTLQAEGHEVICSQHGLDSLKTDVDCVKRCFGRVNGPVVLVGHSYGGTLITHAGMDDRVAALVFIC